MLVLPLMVSARLGDNYADDLEGLRNGVCILEPDSVIQIK